MARHVGRSHDDPAGARRRRVQVRSGDDGRARGRRRDDLPLLPPLEEVAAGAEAADEEGRQEEAEEHAADDDERERPDAGGKKLNIFIGNVLCKYYMKNELNYFCTIQYYICAN